MSQNENKYLVLGFIEFAILATLMTAFFPWSLLFCLFVYGMEETKLIVAALLHDFLKTLFAVFLGVLGIVALVVILLVIFAN
jgi:hypothetical protein